jgi:uncharacterized protein YukE
MRFELPNAVSAINNAVAAVGEDGDSWEVVGDPLTELVDGQAAGYDEKLDLKLDPPPGDKRAEICTVRWGKIYKDVARLNGLADAVESVSAAITSGKNVIAHDWKGESYDAFRTQLEKVEKTLNDYVTAVRTAAAGLQAAVDGTVRMFTRYRDDTIETYLALPGRFSPVDEWKRLSRNDAEYFAAHCVSHDGVTGVFTSSCFYPNEGLVKAIDRKLTTKRLRDQVEKWDCTSNPAVAANHYKYLVDTAYEERGLIRDLIAGDKGWYAATDTLKTQVTAALDAALENLRIIADLRVFATLSVPGATAPGGAPGGDPGPGGGDPGPGGGDPGPGGGYPGPGTGGGDVAMPAQEPPMTVDPTAGPEPEPTEPEATGSESTEEATEPEATEPSAGAETVSVTDGDRTFSVTSPDGQGRVTLTVDDGSGAPKTYSLDFNAASGMGPQPGTEGDQPEPEEGVEQVPARSDGKCVIQDGDLTVTAERPLFSPDSIAITVDDGTGTPTTYTLDFPEDAETPSREDPQASDVAAARPGAGQAQPLTGQAAPEDAGAGALPGAAQRGAAEPVAAQVGPPEPPSAETPSAERPVRRRGWVTSAVPCRGCSSRTTTSGRPGSRARPTSPLLTRPTRRTRRAWPVPVCRWSAGRTAPPPTSQAVRGPAGACTATSSTPASPSTACTACWVPTTSSRGRRREPAGRRRRRAPAHRGDHRGRPACARRGPGTRQGARQGRRRGVRTPGTHAAGAGRAGQAGRRSEDRRAARRGGPAQAQTDARPRRRGVPAGSRCQADRPAEAGPAAAARATAARCAGTPRAAGARGGARPAEQDAQAGRA